MKNITLTLMALFLFSTTTKAQLTQDNYDKLWKEVQQFEEKSLPKSAFKIVETIYKKAKIEGNSPQLIKSLIYKSKYTLLLEEDAKLEVINLFKIEIEKAQTPTKNVLESILANLYWQYFQQNRYKFYNRTKTSGKIDSLDFRTWDLETLFTEVHIHFQNSLKNGLILQQTDLNNYNDILNLQPDSKKYRSTLFDFITNNALEFYKSSETTITNPSYKFELDKESYLENYKAFSQIEIISKDSLSLQLNALKIFKNLIAFHSLNKNIDALISTDIERLKFVKQHATFPEKEAIYLTVLQNLKDEFLVSESSTLIDFEIATIYHNQANEYNAETNTDNQFKNVEALTTCENAISKFHESIGAKNCSLLKQQILSKSLNLTAEKNIPIDTHSKILVNYKNIETLYFTIFKINEDQKNKLLKIYNNEEKVTFIKGLETAISFQQELKTENDYQHHSTEIAIPPLNNGNYLIYASTFETLNANSIYATSTIQVTNIALVENTGNNNYTYQVVVRNSGKPMENAKVNLKNYNTGKYNDPINRNYTSDKNGQVHFSVTNTHRNIVVSIKTKNDNASFGDYYFFSTRNQMEPTEKVKIEPFLFTDRSIYRPGQVVYFKGILIKKEGEISKIVSNELVTITLYNANQEIVTEIKLKTNEFGSFSSEFILPNTGLNGIFTLEVDGINHSETQILVEEYKRPKFETTFKPVTETFKINDSVTINGSALAFAGSNITDAKVTYSVHRKVQYPKWFYWYRPYFSPSESQEITHGETNTDAQGNFIIVFIALADKSVEKDNLPIFNYEITANVTDLNGETKSATSIVKVGYHSLTAKINMDTKIDKTKKENIITVETKNLNNQFYPANGIIKISKLQAPKTVLRKRPWNAPDYQLYNFSAFKNMFPHEPFSNEDEVLNWEKGKLVFEADFNTSIDSKIKLKNIKKWQSGSYLVEIVCFDAFGQKVTDKQIVGFFSEKDTEVSDNQLFTISHHKSSYKPNEIVLLKIGSSSKDLTVTIDIEKEEEIIETKIIHLNNEIKQLEIPVTENDLGGFAINYSYVNYNSFENGTLPISVPYPIKELKIETITFRDKLQPGQNETWSFKLKGTKGEKIAAELLASMYDASLDQFKPHNWEFNPIQHPTYYSSTNRTAQNSFGTIYFNVNNLQRSYYSQIQLHFDELNWFGLNFGTNRNMMIRGMASKKIQESEGFMVEEVEMALDDSRSLDEVVTVGYKNPKNVEDKPEKLDFSSVKIRTNFNETAFFYPHLKTDKEGNVSFNFTVPEALTQWKLQLLGHTKELASATKTLTTVTQKELMVLPNPPRFLREGDEIIFSSKISNLTDKILNGTAQLVLTDAITGKDITKTVIERSRNDLQNFTLAAKGNTSVSWKLNIPEGIQAVQYKIIAKAGDFSDGEQSVLPVLSNRMLVTETLPMWVRSNQTKIFTLDKLLNITSTPLSDRTLKNHKLTLEITSNPAWYAIQSLPYLMEYPYECAEQTFSRYYANALARHIANSNPRIKEVFDLWKNSDALASNLEKNSALKSIIISETPWLRNAQNETEQKKRIGLLFDLNKMKNEQEIALNKLKELQFSNGGFPWFKGSNYPNRYITQHIAASFGHLKKLNIILNEDSASQKMITKAVQFLDDEILVDYSKLLLEAKKIKERAKSTSKGIKAEKDYLEKNHLGNTQLHYLYMRSFYKEVEIPSKVQEAVNYYTYQSANYWTDFSLYSKGMIALIQHRNGNIIISSEILKSLKENSISSEEMGMYWEENTASWFWYQAPIETQALLIEVFSEIENDIAKVDELKVWLLKNKQTNSWRTTKATTEAVYALLLQGSDWLSINKTVEVTVGNQKIEPLKLENVKIEAGTGYFKTSWNGNEITPEMAKVIISKKDKGIAWGSLYWQYFEDLDKITSAETPLKLNKKLFLKSNTDSGKVLTEITETSALKVGNLITVRIELKVDRSMEFVHMKDMRASGLEPLDGLSQYKWQDGLGYYESTKDASTNFFMEYLPKGIYVFEYDLRVNNAGNFSNGITTIQSMYAPEFSSHSEGVRIKVND